MAGAVTLAVAAVLGCQDTPDPIEPEPPPPVGAATAAPVTFVGAGDIATCSGSGDEATARLLDNIPGTVFTLGDNAYSDGSASQYANCYGPTWGRHKARTRPSPGNHEYRTSGASGYFGYFGDAAGPNGRGYYSYDLGEWHIVSLNSNVSMAAGSAQERWLRADLAASAKQCVLAYWHHPRFSSGDHGNTSSTQPLWQALYERGADIVLAGHDHSYERFAPQTPGGQRDDARGIRQFVVGTGGRSHYGLEQRQPNSEVFDGRTYGVLKLSLGGGTYEWEFIPVEGTTFTDRGSGTCHGATSEPPPPPPADTTTPPDTTTAPPDTTSAPGDTTTTPGDTTTTPPPSDEPPPPANGTTTRLTLEPTDTLRLGPVGATATLRVRAWAGTKEVATPVKWWIRSNGVARLSSTRCDAPCSVTVTGRAVGTTLVDVHEYARNSSASRDQVTVKVLSTAVPQPPPPSDPTDPTDPTEPTDPTDPTDPAPTLTQVIVAPDAAALQTGTTQQFAAYGRLSNGDSTAVAVAWAATGGTITAGGLYTAGATAGTFRAVAAASGLADTASVTITAPPPPPPPPPPSGVATCFDAGPATITVSGAFAVNATYDKRNDIPSGARIDARTATWSKNDRDGDYMVRIGTGSNICWHGGSIRGLWDGATEPWETYHSSNGFTGDGANLIFENVRVENYGDGAKFMERASNWTVRRAHFIDIHDDCVETDFMESGTIEDVLFEGCYYFLATRPRSSVVGVVDGRDNTIRVNNAIVWLKAVEYGYDGDRNDLGGFLKIDTYHNPPWGPWHEITNTIVMVDRGVRLNPGGVVTKSENNILVYIGPGDFPSTVPPGWTVTKDRSVYDNAVAAWKAAHPGL